MSSVLATPSATDPAPVAPSALEGRAADVFEALTRDGVVVLPEFATGERLRGMQRAFATVLSRMRWNHFDGYQRTERFRHMVEDVLTLDQGFVDVALDPLVLDVLDAYVGPDVQLAEAKGWKSLPTNSDFHGWHGDAWYDQSVITDHIPREVKLAVYLSDVRSGAFQYLVGSHQQQHPKVLSTAYVNGLGGEIRTCTGAAGTAILFDTSGIHRQAMPLLEERQAIFLNYHDRRVPLQREDVSGYRYHPLLLNAAFLGGLTPRGMRVLGFGDTNNYQPHWKRGARYEGFQRTSNAAWGVRMRVNPLINRVSARLAKTFGSGR